MAIETKDKLVTLEDLKAAYDSLVEQIASGGDMWADITNQLTWETGKCVELTLDQGTTEYSYKWVDNSGRAATQYCYYAEVPGINVGDRYRITGWHLNSPTNGLYVLLNSSGGLIDLGYIGKGTGSTVSTTLPTKEACGQYIFETVEVTVPEKATKLIILNWNKQMDTSYDLSDIIVEKRG